MKNFLDDIGIDSLSDVSASESLRIVNDAIVNETSPYLPLAFSISAACFNTLSVLRSPLIMRAIS